MSLGGNLQYLRKKENITQEQLAERLEVSRQTISKWESDTSYPEMDKILILCEMFGCSMDALLRGNVEEFSQEDKEIYESHMNDFSQKIAGSVCAIIVGAGLSALAEGMGFGEPIQALVFFSMLIVAVVILVVTGIQHSEFCRRYPVVHIVYSEEEQGAAAGKFSVRMGVGIGGILFGLLWSGVTDGMQLEEGILGGIFLIIVAVGVWFLIYGGMQKEKYDIEKYNRENNPTEEEKRRSEKTGAYCGCIMIFATIVYLLLGFLADVWEIAWVAYVVGGLLCGITAVGLNILDRK